MSTAVVSRPNFSRDLNAGFKSVAQLLGAIQARALGGVETEQLRFLAALGSDEQSSGSPPYGGYLIPPGLARMVLRVPPQDDPMSGITEVTMRVPRLPVPARTDKDHSTSTTGGIVVTRHPETVELTPQRGQLEQILLDSHELAAFTYGTSRIVDDSGGMFLQWLETCFRDALAAQLREERIRGTGVGQCLGVLASPSLITIDKEGGQAAGTVVAENALKMSARCWGYDGASASWIAHPELRTTLSLLQDTTTGTPLYHFPETEGGRPRLCGVRVFYDERASAPGSVGDLILGVWSEYLNAVYVSPRVDSSLHVRFISNEVGFRFYTRGDGAPWWASALTPANGTLTLSPFVTLAERS